MSQRGPLSPPGKRTSFWSPTMQDECARLFGDEDAALQAVRRESAARGYPDIAVSATDGQVLRLLVRASGARHAVEIGTLGGYSALWIARAMEPGARLDSFELDSERAAFAQEHLSRTVPDVRVVVHAGPALEHLAKVTGLVDFVFIDADKTRYPQYFAWAAEHLRPGGIVAIDNAFAWGGLVDPSALGDQAASGEAMRATMAALAGDPRFTSAMVPTNEGLAVGFKHRT